MDANIIAKAAQATQNGSMPFPAIVGALIETGVEYYHVDYVALQMRFYGAKNGAKNGVHSGVVSTPITFEQLPAVALEFNADALRAAILDSQQNGQHFRAFTERAMAAGVQSYFAFLSGQRVTYFGRKGEQHTEWFPGAKPTDA